MEGYIEQTLLASQRLCHSLRLKAHVVNVLTEHTDTWSNSLITELMYPRQAHAKGLQGPRLSQGKPKPKHGYTVTSANYPSCWQNVICLPARTILLELLM